MKKQLQQIIILIFSIVIIGGCGVHSAKMDSEGTVGMDVVGDGSAEKKGEEGQEEESTVSVTVTESPAPQPEEENEIMDDVVNSGEDLDPWGAELVREHLAAVYSWSHAAADPLGEMAQDPIVLEYKDTVDRLILSLPKTEECGVDLSFFYGAAEEQFLAIDWGKYEFASCDSTFIYSNKDDLEGDICLKGYVYLKNSSEIWKEEYPAIFLQFTYVISKMEPRHMEIIEIVEAGADILNYIWAYDRYGDYDNNTGDRLVVSSGTRMLDRTRGPAPRQELIPLPGLEDEELYRYIEKIFLELCRYPDHLNAFDQIFPAETMDLLGTLEIYNEKPYEIYDYARADYDIGTWGERGEVLVSSQFSPLDWNSFPEVCIEFDYTYDSETGQVRVKGGGWFVAEK